MHCMSIEFQGTSKNIQELLDVIEEDCIVRILAIRREGTYIHERKGYVNHKDQSTNALTRIGNGRMSGKYKSSDNRIHMNRGLLGIQE